MAEKDGVKNVIMSSSIRSVELAYEIALNMKNAILQEKEISEERNTIIDSIKGIIIYINRRRRITIFSSQAEEIFECRVAKAVGENIYSICKSFNPKNINEIFETGKQSIGNVIEISNKKYVLNLNPVVVRDDVVSVIISMQEIKLLQKIETKVRQGLYLKGNVAKYKFQDIQGESQEIRKNYRVSKEICNNGIKHIYSWGDGNG